MVKSLVATDKTNLKAIDTEIEALKKKAATLQAQAQQQQVAGANTEPTPTPATAEQQGPLKVDKPTTQLPERNPKAKIAGPSISPVITTSPVPTKATE